VQDYLSQKARRIAPYTAGAQPQAKNIIKLNTNENPYPPSAATLAAYAGLDTAALRLYPRPDGGTFRSAAARIHNLPESHVFCGNGSDEVLGFAFAAFFDGPIMFADITYSFYPVWAALFDIPYTLLPLCDDFTIPVDRLRSGGIVLANPNAPTGIALPLSDIETVLHQNSSSVVIVDEAYTAFGGESAAPLVTQYPNLLVVHTLSKSHCLAGMRMGYALGQPHLIEGLERIKDSFNSYPLDTAAQAVGSAALLDTAYYQDIARKIIATRTKTTAQLTALGFGVCPSSANFVFITHAKLRAEDLQAFLEQHGIFVRRFNLPRIDNYLRITIGTDAQMDTLIDTIRAYV
jgi:histidinol-phosphate aminotransferase